MNLEHMQIMFDIYCILIDNKQLLVFFFSLLVDCNNFQYINMVCNTVREMKIDLRQNEVKTVVMDCFIDQVEMGNGFLLFSNLDRELIKYSLKKKKGII